MLSVSRVAAGCVRPVAHPAIVRVRNHLLAAGEWAPPADVITTTHRISIYRFFSNPFRYGFAGCSQQPNGRRWISRKVNRNDSNDRSDPSSEPCPCNEETSESTSDSGGAPCEDSRRIPMMGELIQFPNDPSPYPAPPRRHVPIKNFFKVFTTFPIAILY